MKVALIGSRTLLPHRLPLAKQALMHHFPEASTLISGGARGADSFAPVIAGQLRLPFTEHPVDEAKVRFWEMKGLSHKAAYAKEAHARNALIEAGADACLAILDKPLEESKGTAHCVSLFKAAGKRVEVLEITEPIRIVNCHWQKPEIYCGRTWKGYSASPLGNPFRVGDSRGDAIERYRFWLWEQIQRRNRGVIDQLLLIEGYVRVHGSVDLGCWCHPAPCHLEKIIGALYSNPVQAILMEEGAKRGVRI